LVQVRIYWCIVHLRSQTDVVVVVLYLFACMDYNIGCS
jgi:hypothetical protein